MTIEFNRRAEKARLSAGWSHDRRYFNFMREHNSRAPFVEPGNNDSFADALIGVIALAVLMLVVLLLGGW